jgi:hypothetical protein
MLLIIYLMFFLSVYQDETISCYFTAPFKKARLSAGKGRPWLFFLCFFRQVSPAAREYCDRFRVSDEAVVAGWACSDRETPISRRQRCTRIVANDVASAIDCSMRAL